MQFWSNVEKEYNDLFGGEEGEKEDKDEGKMETEFDDMVKDIKKDLKNVSKDDLLPGLAPMEAGSDTDGDETDDGDARKDLKRGEAKKKKGKRCKIGDKTYAVGERWKDPKTGNDMICILMNIPKEVQPKLAEADVTITREEENPEEPELKPTSSGPQWSYTNKTPKARGCPSDKESEKPDQAGSEAENGNEDQASGDEGKPTETPLDRETENMDREMSQEDEGPAGEGGENASVSEKGSTRGNSGKETDGNTEEEKLGRLEEDEKEDGREETESDTDSEEERRQAEKAARDEEESDEYEEREEDSLKYKMGKDSEVNVTKEDRESAVVQDEKVEPEKTADPGDKGAEEKEEEKKEKETKGEDATEDARKIESNSLEKTSEEPPVAQEKGKTIYTKETTVTQRKLFKTSETIESVETEKNVS